MYKSPDKFLLSGNSVAFVLSLNLDESLSALDHHHHEVIVLGALVAQVPGDPPEEVQAEVAGREGIEHAALLGGLVAQADHARRVLYMTAVTACMTA